MGIRFRSTGLAAATFLLVGGLVTDGSAQPTGPIRQILGLRSPMRDGVRLSSDVWLPKAPGRYPIILIRSPYLKGLGFFQDQAEYFARRGYAVVAQDARGRGDSEGEFAPFFAESADGYDTIEHLASQPWSNGRVGMMGGSYMGSTQWLAARERPPHLVCIASTSPAARFGNELPYYGGAFAMQFAIQWLHKTWGRGAQGNDRAIDWAGVFAHRPLRTMDEAMGREMPILREWLDHDGVDDYWKRIVLGPKDFAGIEIPVLMIVGLFDGDQPGAMYDWLNVEAHSPAAAGRRHLLMGPWTHGQAVWGGAAEAGARKFPATSIVDYNALLLAFFEKYLRQSTGVFDQPRVRLYLTGADVWRDFAEYPAARPVAFHLSSGGRANTAAGDGVLSTAPPAGPPTDSYRYDPRNPVVNSDPAPVVSLTVEYGGSGDRTAIQSRDDVLVYTSAPLGSPLEVVGLVEVELHASTDARDTDFTASLTDVGPDGKAISLGPLAAGIVRARYRDGAGKPSLLEPGRPYRFTIELGHVAHSFEPGHRIRLEISSSAWPLFNPNQNTGSPIADDTEWKVANQTIHHTTALPSALKLPVLNPAALPR